MALATNPPYVPNNPTVNPQSPDMRALLAYVQQELANISDAMNDISRLQLNQITKAPPVPREGLVVYADGVSWNPNGWGKGLRVYDATAAQWRAVLGSVFGLTQVAAPSNANAATAGVPVGGFYTSTADPHVVYLRTA